MTARVPEHTAAAPAAPRGAAPSARASALQAWVRALSATAPIGSEPAATLPVVIERLADRFEAAPALLSPGAALSYRALAQSVRRYARWGRSQGWGAGDVVALLMPNCPDYMAIWLGLTRIGVTVSLLNTHLAGTALVHSINVVAPRALLLGAALASGALAIRSQLPADLSWWAHGEGAHGLPRLDLQAAQAADTPLPAEQYPPPVLAARALYIYTSGTTGLPKAANVSHLRVMQWSHWFAGMMNIQPADRMYDCLPMYHSIGGVVATAAVLAGGGAVVLRERFSAREFWTDVVRERCTLFQYIGELCRYLLNGPAVPEETQHQLRLCCGNGLRAEVWEPFQRRFHIPQILEYYASTEGNFSLYNCEGRVGAIGRIPPFLSHRLRVALIRVDPLAATPLRGDDGLCRRCPAGEAGEAIGEISSGAHAASSGSGEAGALGGRFEGYTDGEASARKILRDVFAPGDAWYRTGDLMRQDEQGFFYFVDRLGDTYRWKGENVSTAEVAAAIAACRGVRDAAVYGVSVAGAEGRAGMAALAVDEPFDLAALRAALAAALPEYARPLFVRIVPALALTGTFKLSKRQLLEEGYDPQRVTDPLYFDDRADGRYLPLDTNLYRRLQAGSLRL
jgi:fatty-acyl-CoA synthase